ncbi:hypothetical protein ACFVUY_36495 [Kitasatospora sp. NPDC058063]|uniref:hypothetical protein n=1 Tax=unclassified Kitasatospora TaxID=2633591 RepID=UPI0036D7C689
MLEDVGQLQEAEAVLRESIATHDHPAHRAGLMNLLKRQNRLDEAVEVGRPTYDYYDCGNLVHSAVQMLDEDGRPGRAAELLEEYSAECVQEHRWWILPTRWALMGKSGRCREAIAEIMALPGEEREEWVTVLAFMLELDGRVDEAVELLRSTGTASAMEELADLLVRQGRPAEALAVAPTLVAYREQQERRRETWAGTMVNADGYSTEPPFQPLVAQGTASQHVDLTDIP